MAYYGLKNTAPKDAEVFMPVDAPSGLIIATVARAPYVPLLSLLSLALPDDTHLAVSQSCRLVLVFYFFWIDLDFYWHHILIFVRTQYVQGLAPAKVDCGLRSPPSPPNITP